MLPQPATVVRSLIFPRKPIKAPTTKPINIGSPKIPSFFCNVVALILILSNPIFPSIQFIITANGSPSKW